MAFSKHGLRSELLHVSLPMTAVEATRRSSYTRTWLLLPPLPCAVPPQSVSA
jgi:hypothetical protein